MAGSRKAAILDEKQMSCRTPPQLLEKPDCETSIILFSKFCSLAAAAIMPGRSVRSSSKVRPGMLCIQAGSSRSPLTHMSRMRARCRQWRACRWWVPIFGHIGMLAPYIDTTTRCENGKRCQSSCRYIPEDRVGQIEVSRSELFHGQLKTRRQVSVLVKVSGDGQEGPRPRHNMSRRPGPSTNHGSRKYAQSLMQQPPIEQTA